MNDKIKTSYAEQVRAASAELARIQAALDNMAPPRGGLALDWGHVGSMEWVVGKLHEINVFLYQEEA